MPRSGLVCPQRILCCGVCVYSCFCGLVMLISSHQCRRLHRPDVARVARCIETQTWEPATVRRKLLPLLIEWDAQVRDVRHRKLCLTAASYPRLMSSAGYPSLCQHTAIIRTACASLYGTKVVHSCIEAFDSRTSPALRARSPAPRRSSG